MLLTNLIQVNEDASYPDRFHCILHPNLCELVPDLPAKLSEP